MKECVNHELLHHYPILTEKPGEFVAQFKCTVVMLQSGTILLTGLPFEEENYETEKKVTDPEMIELLKVSNSHFEILFLETNGNKEDQKKGKTKESTNRRRN